MMFFYKHFSHSIYGSLRIESAASEPLIWLFFNEHGSRSLTHTVYAASATSDMTVF